MRASTDEKSKNKSMGGGQEAKEAISDRRSLLITRALRRRRAADNRGELECLGYSGEAGAGAIFSQSRLSIVGGGLRRLLGASESRLAGIIEQKRILILQRENLTAQIELLERLEQEEQQNLSETRRVFSDWEDEIAALLPINNQDALTN
jgi:hypothetical protein